MTQNLTEIKLGPASDIPPGEGRVYQIEGERIAVFRTRAQEVYAVQAECAQARAAGGWPRWR